MDSTQNNGRLAGQIAVITGAGGGIGRAIALRFAAEGAAVAVVDIAVANAEAVAAELTAAGRRAIAIQADVGKASEVTAAFAQVADELGAATTLVNNAGDVTIAKHFLETDEAWWDHFLDTNLKSHYLCCRAAADVMVANGGGAIINMSSGGATRAHRGMVAYDASKGGVEGFTRSLALDLAPYGIRVNALVPGLIATRPEHLAGIAGTRRNETIPLGRGGSPDDLAGPAVFLASDDAAYMTGSVVVVDGGVLVQQRSPQVETFPLDRFPKVGRLSET